MQFTKTATFMAFLAAASAQFQAYQPSGVDIEIFTTGDCSGNDKATFGSLAYNTLADRGDWNNLEAFKSIRYSRELADNEGLYLWGHSNSMSNAPVGIAAPFANWHITTLRKGSRPADGCFHLGDLSMLPVAAMIAQDGS